MCCGKTVVYEKVGLPTSILETNSPQNLDFCIFILNYITKPFLWYIVGLHQTDMGLGSQ